MKAKTGCVSFQIGKIVLITFCEPSGMILSRIVNAVPLYLTSDIVGDCTHPCVLICGIHSLLPTC